MDTETTEETEVEDTAEDKERTRSTRPAKFEKKLKSKIPDTIRSQFEEKGFGIRYKVYRLANIVQNSQLAELLRDGWEFVQSSELPDWYADYFETEEFRARGEILVAHDLVLMKHSLEYIKSEKDYYDGLTQAELASVNTNILEKKGFITKGSNSSITMSEPRFKD